MECRARGAIETDRLFGPEGLSAVGRIWSEDDGNKNLHNCQAGYELLVAASPASPVKVGNFQATHVFPDWDRSFQFSDNEYGRALSIHLDGFSRDSKSMFGIISERGEYPLDFLFNRDVASGRTRMVDLKDLAEPDEAKCATSFAVVGTAGRGSMVVVEVRRAEPCRTRSRWEIQPNTTPWEFEEHPAKNGKLHALPEGTAITPLYEGGKP